jgi:hypothetical protein
MGFARSPIHAEKDAVQRRDALPKTRSWGKLRAFYRPHGGEMLQRKKLHRSAAALFIALTGCGTQTTAATLKAESASASTNARSQELATTIALHNVSGKTLQAFMMIAPNATDDAGNAYTSTSLAGPAVGGVAVCWSGSHCLTDDKAKTESNATQIDADDSITLAITFCCKVSGGAMPTKGTAGIVLHVRESSDGQNFGPWHSVSVNVPSFAVSAGK